MQLARSTARWWLLLMILTGHLWANASGGIHFRRVGLEGLSQQTVHAMVQDQRGFMWFGTLDGLNLYNGYDFTVYKRVPGDPTTLTDNFIRTLFLDRDGSVWIGTANGGVNRLDPMTDVIKSWQMEPGKSGGLSTNKIEGICQDSHGLIWIATAKGLNRLNPKTDEVMVWDARRGGLSDDYIESLVVTPDNMFWVATRGGLNRFDPATNTVSSFMPSGPGSISYGNAETLWLEGNGDLWVGTYGGGLNFYNAETGRFRAWRHDPDHESISNDIVKVVMRDSRGHIWAGTRDGLARLDPALNQWQTFRHDPTNPNSLSHSDIQSILEDRNGLIWVGTRNGLNLYNPATDRFENWGKGGVADDELFRDIQALLVTSDHDLWIGSRSAGLYQFDRATRKTRSIRAGSEGLSHNDVKALAKAPDNALWVGTWGGGLNRYHIDSGKVEVFRDQETDQGTVTRDYIWTLLTDEDGSPWMGTGDGLHHLDLTSGRVTGYHAAPGRKGALHSGQVTVLHQGEGPMLWVGTDEGLTRFDRNRGVFTRWPDPNIMPRDMRRLTVNALLVNGTDVWIGSAGSGLVRADTRDSSEYQVLTSNDGLPTDGIQGIFRDARNRLWLSTARGISRFDLLTETFKSYDTADGTLPGYSTRAGAVGLGGELLFGGIHGLTAFFPNDLEARAGPPPVMLTRLTILNEPVAPGGGDRLIDENGAPSHVSMASALNLTYHDTVFSLEFAALDYSDPQRNRYAYRLVGFDDRWIQTGADKRFATYTRLEPGDYVFQVKSASLDGPWSDQVADLEIHMEPPPWRTLPAYLLYTVIVLGIIAALVRAERAKLLSERRVVRRLREYDKLKDQFLANTSHELRTPLHGMIGLAESLRANVPNNGEESRKLGMIVSSGKRLSGLVDSILDFARLKEEGVSLHLSQVDVRLVTEMVLTLTEPLLNGKPVVLLNEIPPDLPRAAADEGRLLQILHNLVGNAVKFTDSGQVRVTGRVADDRLEFRVIDTGIGIDPKHHNGIFESFQQADGSVAREYGGTGLGLAVTRELVALHGGRIRVESKPGQGSTFIFTLPKADGSTPAAVAREERGPMAPEPESSEMMAMPDLEPARYGDDPMLAGLDGLRVLVADDEPVNRQILIDHLARYKVEVIEAADGLEALDIMERPNSCDLLLVDVMMPRLSGYEVCQRLRTRYSATALPIILLTAKNTSADMIAGFKAGANDYITKPFVKGELLARIEAQLELVLAHREHAVHRQLELAKARAEGVARFAHSVLHNTGNVLNGVNVSCDNLLSRLERSKAGQVARIGDLLKENQDDLAHFFNEDPRGKMFLQYVPELGRALDHEHGKLREEVRDMKDQLRLVKDLLTKQQTGARRERDLETVNLNQILGQVIKIQSRRLEEEHVAIDAVIPSDIHVKVDRTHLTHVLINLLKNAVEAMGETDSDHRRLIYSVEELPEDRIRLTQKDNGHGISAENLNRMFVEEFTTKDSGHGFGLPYCARVMKDMGGEIQVASEGEGKGAAFSLVLQRIPNP